MNETKMKPEIIKARWVSTPFNVNHSNVIALKHLIKELNEAIEGAVSEGLVDIECKVLNEVNEYMPQNAHRNMAVFVITGTRHK